MPGMRAEEMMMFVDSFAVLRFHFVEPHFLLGREKGGDLFVCLCETIQDLPQSLAPNNLQVGSRFFDERFDLRHLRISQV